MGIAIAVVLLLVGAILGAFATILMQGYLTRPRLRIAGSGGGIGPAQGFRQVAITIRNEPGFLNLRLGHTTILGKRVIKGRTIFSVPFERLPAYDCTAMMIAEGARQGVGLWWLLPEGENAVNNTLTIVPGKTASLSLFVREESDSDHYFPYQPASVSSGVPAVPPNSARMAGERTFDVTLHYSYGQEMMKFKVSVYVDPQGNLHLEMPSGSSIF
jgi:hypothetical protein